MSQCASRKIPAVIFVLLVITLPATISRTARAQTVCQGPFLGKGSPQEICVMIQETGIAGGAKVFRRGPSPLSIQSLTVGAYTLSNVTLTFSAGGGSSVSAGGMALAIRGMVSRTSPGNGGLSIAADGGLGFPLGAASSGLINLTVSATGTSNSQVGGGAGYLIPDLGDIAFVSLGLVTCEVNTPGQGGGCQKDELPIQTSQPLVALRNITGIHLNSVMDSLMLPSSVGVGDLPLPADETDDVITLSVPASLLNATSAEKAAGATTGRVPNHFPVSQFVLTPPDVCPAEHWHLAGDSATSVEGITIRRGDCEDGAYFQTPASVLEMEAPIRSGEAQPSGPGCPEGFCADGTVVNSFVAGASPGDACRVEIDYDQCQKTSNPAVIACADESLKLTAGNVTRLGLDNELTVLRQEGEFHADSFGGSVPAGLAEIITLSLEGFTYGPWSSVEYHQ